MCFHCFGGKYCKFMWSLNQRCLLYSGACLIIAALFALKCKTIRGEIKFRKHSPLQQEWLMTGVAHVCYNAKWTACISALKWIAMIQLLILIFIYSFDHETMSYGVKVPQMNRRLILNICWTHTGSVSSYDFFEIYEFGLLLVLEKKHRGFVHVCGCETWNVFTTEKWVAHYAISKELPV